jgi:hypothetical protein
MSRIRNKPHLDDEAGWDQSAAVNKRLRSLSREEKIRLLREKVAPTMQQEAVRDFVVLRNYDDKRFPTVMIVHLPTMLYRDFNVPPEEFEGLMKYFRQHPEGDKSLVESIVLMK